MWWHGIAGTKQVTNLEDLRCEIEGQEEEKERPSGPVIHCFSVQPEISLAGLYKMASKEASRAKYRDIHEKVQDEITR